MLPKISIIIPAYNCAKFISKAIESALNQTYVNTEIIVINDGSNDGNETEKTILAVSDRIIYVNKENGGVSSARNKGIEVSTGDYIMFIDSDDWVDENICEAMLDTALNHNCDIVLCDYMREFEDSSIPKHTFEKDIVFNKDEVRKLHRRLIGLVGEELRDFSKFDSLSTVWAKLYKAELIKDNKIEFYDIRKTGTFEDGLFNIDVFFYANKLAYIDLPMYHYQKNNDNSLTTKYKNDLIKKHEHIHSYLHEYIKRNNLPEEYTIALYNRVAHALVGYGLNILKSPHNKTGAIKKILSSSNYKHAFNSLEIEYLPFHWKLFYFIARKNFATGIYLMLKCISIIINR